MHAFFFFLSLSWGWWVFGAVTVVAVILFVVFPLVIFVTALFERLHLRQLRPATGEKAEATWRHATVAEATALGYEPVGVFSDGDRGIKEGIITLMLSPDRYALLWVLHGAMAGRHRLISRSADGHGLITASVTGIADLSGMQDEKMLSNVPLPVMDDYHRERLSRWPHPPVPWDPATVPQDILAYERHRVDRIVAGGFARYIEPGHVYKYRFAGAARVTGSFWAELFTLGAAQKLAEARKQSYENRRRWALAAGGFPGGYPAGAPSTGPQAPGFPVPPADPLAAAATEPARRPEFVRLLAERGVYVVTRPHETEPGSGVVGEHDVHHLDYVEAGVHVYPVFSSETRAAHYVQHHPESDSLHPFYSLAVSAAWLLSPELTRFRLVLNPGSEAETVITPQDLAALRAMTSVRTA